MWAAHIFTKQGLDWFKSGVPDLIF